ncbi:MAG TPA: VanW family protein [Pyrinomonadaceae bacterium]
MQNSSKPEKRIHTRPQALVFRAKAFLLQLKRGAENLFDSEIRRFPKSENLLYQPVIAESKTPLWTESAPAEQILLAGKVHNLRLAVSRLDGLEIPAGATFSFWKQTGRAGASKGYVAGRELREGCIVPNIGGGLCQISNALYDAALAANFEIVERHAHTQIIAGSLAERGRDATVFWNYVDLRFRSSKPFRIEARLGKDHLRVTFKGVKETSKTLFQIAKLRTPNPEPGTPANSCATCGVESCFRSLKTDANPDFGRTAFLLDEFAPEFNEYVQKTRGAKDFLFIPLDGKRFKKANYAWETKGFARVRQSFFQTFLRSYRSRKLAAQGATRQKSLLESAEKLADSYAKKLTFDATHLVVSQNLLPFLWKNGFLGGRTFDVLMSALPVSEIQKRLDFAFSLNPNSPTLGDFRAADGLIQTEREALENARKIITPHTEIAELFGARAELLDWHLPEANQLMKGRNNKFTIVFPASTVGRKGCYELREAVRGLDVKIVTLGACVEEKSFWDGIDWEKGDDDWLGNADLVVLPAFVEHKPRRLLAAAAHNIPVIASASCGVKKIKGIVTIETGDAEILRREIENILKPDERIERSAARVFV